MNQNPKPSLQDARLAFEAACAKQNAEHAAKRAAARSTGAACSVTPMLAFGGTPYCTTHGVMGPCSYAGKGGAA